MAVRPGSILCGNNPTKIAVGYCPDLDTPLCQESFDMLKSQPALRHITLTALHKMDEKRRRCPETQEPYTLFDTVLQKPISTVAKLVGSSKEHEVCSIDDAAAGKREDLRSHIRQLSDQVSSVRVAQSQIEKLVFAIAQSHNQMKDDVQNYFTEFQERLQRRKKEVLRDLQVEADKKLGPLKALSEQLPLLRERAEDITEKASEILTLSDIEFLVRTREKDALLGSVELRLDNLGDGFQAAKTGLHFESDDRYLFLDQSCKVHGQRRDPDLEKSVSLLATLLGQQVDRNNEREFLPPPERATNSREGPRRDNMRSSGGEPGWKTFDEQPDRQPQEDRRRHDLPDQGRPDHGPRRSERRDITDRPLRPQTFTFDPKYMEQTLQLTPSGRSVLRRSPKAVSGLCCTNQLLPLGERIDFGVEELNLYLSGSGCIGVTPIRSLSSLLENALYLDLHSGAIYNEGSQVCVISTDELALSEGDIISIVLHTDRSLTFYHNRRPLSKAVENCPDLVYPFVNVAGKMIKFSITE